MKAVQFTVVFTGEIPIDVDENELFLSLDLSRIKVQRFTGPEDGQEEDVSATLHEYETCNVEVLDGLLVRVVE